MKMFTPTSLPLVDEPRVHGGIAVQVGEKLPGPLDEEGGYDVRGALRHVALNSLSHRHYLQGLLQGAG